MKNFLRIFYFLLFLILIFLIYLSTFGIETKRLNNQISNKIKNIDENLIIELRDVKIILDPSKLLSVDQKFETTKTKAVE